MSKFRILAIDGGGIRGVIPAVFLATIAQRLGGASLSEHFDLITGTSTGSIIAAAAASNEDMSECIKLYKLLGPEIFPPMTVHRRPWRWTDLFRLEPTYDDKPLETALQKLFGLNRRLGDDHLTTKLLIPAYDVFNRQIF